MVAIAKLNNQYSVTKNCALIGPCLDWLPGLDFINIFHAAFTSADPKWVKMTIKFSIFFMLQGSTSVKAARKTLMELSPDCTWPPTEVRPHWDQGWFLRMVELDSWIENRGIKEELQSDKWCKTANIFHGPCWSASAEKQDVNCLKFNAH